MRVYWRGVRARPPKAPRNLARLPEHRDVHDGRGRRRSCSSARRPSCASGASGSTGTDTSSTSVAAERGYLREAGNLLFHVSVLDRARGLRGRWPVGLQGRVIVVTKDGFANTLSQYDDFRAGALFDPADARAVRLHRRRLRGDLHPGGSRGRDGARVRGRPDLPHLAGRGREAAADLGQPPADHRRHRRLPDQPRLRTAHHGAQRRQVRGVLRTGGVPARGQHLPVLRGGQGARHPAGGRAATQIGLEGEFYPTYGFTKASGPFSAFPDSKNPAISMLAWSGDLGLDAGSRSRSTRCRRRDSTRSAPPTASRCGSTWPWDAPATARRARDGDLRRGQPLREAAGQPHPRPEGRARRGRARPARPARLAVHPAASDLGAGSPRGRAYSRRRRWARPQRGRGPRRRDRDLHRLALPAATSRSSPRRRRRRDPRAVRGAQQPGGRCVRGRLLPGAARARRPVGLRPSVEPAVAVEPVAVGGAAALPLAGRRLQPSRRRTPSGSSCSAGSGWR